MKKIELSRRNFIIRTSILAAYPAIAGLPNVSFAGTGFMTNSQAEMNILKHLYGYCGERFDHIGRNYLLGNGYRCYAASTMSFWQADSMSPYNKGGINPYAYCLNDPINFSDPTGHSPNAAGILGISTNLLWTAFNASIVGLILLGTITGGAVFGLIASAFGILSGILGVAASSLDDSNSSKKALSTASSACGIIAGASATVSLGFAAASLSADALIAWESVHDLTSLKQNSDILLPFARRVTGAIFEGSNASANMASTIAGAVGDQNAVNIINNIKIGINILPVFAYFPLNFKGLSKGIGQYDVLKAFQTNQNSIPNLIGDEVGTLNHLTSIYRLKFTKEIIRNVNHSIHLVTNFTTI
ncbi:RHS repeat-associated core domain-containing protein [Photobacterium kishitanii]|uniref:RHS repeat-associated core domain-containing protein n=1 Tax=Photobacterium kishitanii TaxID=318456 RepID=UPI000D168DA5|nr:RHS repeat-associated core domain-containing protein [Photobacterium kishitanii]PSU15747.1 hypothetical protein CTM84_20155 [Photobacterium kishitanii]